MFKAKIIAGFLVPSIIAYVIASGWVFRGDEAAFLNLEALKHAAVLSLAAALAQDIIPRSFKEAIVFFRFRNRLPSYRCFAAGFTDRYDLSRISNIESIRQLPLQQQQDLFYRIYKKHWSDQSVSQASFRYVAWRDTAALWILIGVTTPPVAYFLAGPAHVRQALELSGLAIGMYLLCVLAARTNASAFVTQVLACETAEHPHAIS